MSPLKFGGKEDMFVVVTYDVNVKRCSKVMKYMRQWLGHRQRSVFSGFLTTTQLRVMQHGLRNLINPEEDSIIIFKTNRADQIEEWMTGKAAEVQKNGFAATNSTRTGKKQKNKSSQSLTGGKQGAFKFRF